jgi:hypothetical protein
MDSVSTDDLSLDHDTVGTQLAEAPVPPPDPWRERRLLGFGASDVPVLLQGFGMREYESPPDYIKAKANHFISPVGKVPRLILERAGIKSPLKAGKEVKELGNDREQELCFAWKQRLLRGEYACPEEGSLDPNTIRHASSVPQEWFPLVNRSAPELAVTPDSWCRDEWDCLWQIEFKCSVHEVPALRPWWADQVQAQLATIPAVGGMVVCGERWAAKWRDDGEIRAWPVHRNHTDVAMILEACRLGWNLVKQLKEKVG